VVEFLGQLVGYILAFLLLCWFWRLFLGREARRAYAQGMRDAAKIMLLGCLLAPLVGIISHIGAGLFGSHMKNHSP